MDTIKNLICILIIVPIIGIIVFSAVNLLIYFLFDYSYYYLQHNPILWIIYGAIILAFMVVVTLELFSSNKN